MRAWREEHGYFYGVKWLTCWNVDQGRLHLYLCLVYLRHNRGRFFAPEGKCFLRLCQHSTDLGNDGLTTMRSRLLSNPPNISSLQEAVCPVLYVYDCSSRDCGSWRTDVIEDLLPPAFPHPAPLHQSLPLCQLDPSVRQLNCLAGKLFASLLWICSLLVNWVGLQWDEHDELQSKCEVMAAGSREGEKLKGGLGDRGPPFVSSSDLQLLTLYCRTAHWETYFITEVNCSMGYS